MTTKYQRKEVYDKVFDFMLQMDLCDLPTPVETICRILGIDLVGLSQIRRDLKWSEKRIFDVWQNENGHLMPFRDKNGRQNFRIAYNDNPSHLLRKRFTIAEEIMHIILEHYQYDMYSINGFEDWDEGVYRSHDECARIGAGILLCPPWFFYAEPSLINLGDIQNFCDVSEKCAQTRISVLNMYRGEIISHPLYGRLERNYSIALKRGKVLHKLRVLANPTKFSQTWST